MNKGFTLVEILVVIVLVAIAGTMLITIFANTLRGSNKSQILAVIKQNGQAVLDKISKDIRDSDNVLCTNQYGDTLVVVKNGIYTRYRFIPPRNTNATLGSCGSLLGDANGCIQQDNPVQPATGVNSDIKFFKDNVCTDPMGTDAPIVNTLTDTKTLSGISVENGQFLRDKPAGYREQVTVKFELKAGVDVPPAISDQVGTINFQTSIQLR